MKSELWKIANLDCAKEARFELKKVTFNIASAKNNRLAIPIK